MPTDTKRLAGPVNAIPLLTFAAQSQSSDLSATLSINKPLLDVEGKRQDGRKPDDLRPFFLKTKVVSQANGSAYMEIGDTKVICAVYGPREIAKRQDFRTNGQIFCEFKYAPFACPRRRSYQQDADERELSGVLKEALEPAVCLYKFPKAQVDVYVTVLDSSGSAFASAITVAGAALVNAGIPMYDVLIGCSLRCSGEQLLIDPSSVEEDSRANDGDQKGNVTMALMPSLLQVTGVVQDGSLEKSTVVRALKLLTDSCQQILPAVQRNLITSWKQELKEKSSKDIKS